MADRESPPPEFLAELLPVLGRGIICGVAYVAVFAITSPLINLSFESMAFWLTTASLGGFIYVGFGRCLRGLVGAAVVGAALAAPLGLFLLSGYSGPRVTSPR